MAQGKPYFSIVSVGGRDPSFMFRFHGPDGSVLAASLGHPSVEEVRAAIVLLKETAAEADVMEWIVGP
ncbi:MAG: hypothetical protein OYH76_24725 [Defluviicoccus sp.]|nr:hypothetical protein [Defluviicoccus sp.]MDE0279113.1 hypothetical protein [Defluviicoccus sp.]